MRWLVPAIALLWAASAVPVRGASSLDASWRERAVRWLQADDGVLVVLVLEGLRSDALTAERRDGTPLMPFLTELAARSIRFDDVLTGAPHVGAGAFELLSGTEARRYLPAQGPWSGGFTRLVEEGFAPLVGGGPDDDRLESAFPWVSGAAAGDLESFLERLQTTLATGGRHLAVYFSEVTLPPYELHDTQLDATDPQPWADASPNATAGELADRRRSTARSMTRAMRTGQSLGTRRHGEVFRWIAQAAAADADEIVARVAAVLEATGTWPRASVLVTSTSGTAVGDRGVVGAASGVDLGQASVPLVWYLPGATEAARSTFPAQLRDVASTLVSLLGAPGPETGLDLLGDPPRERDRTSVAWFARAGQPRASFRLTNEVLTLLVDSEGDADLFDRRWDPRELEDLSAREEELVRTQRDGLARRLWGDEPQLWILVKGDADQLVSAVVRGPRLGVARALGLEDLDAIQTLADRVTMSLVTDEADVIQIPLPRGFEDVVVEIQSPRARSPLYLGLSGLAWSGRQVSLGSFEPATLEAWAGDDPPDPVRWLADRPSGVVVWLVGG